MPFTPPRPASSASSPRDQSVLAGRAPMRELIEEMDVHLARLAPEMGGDPRRSMFRIHRDIRFSKDKSPYKTNAACWFYHPVTPRRVEPGG